MKIATVWLVIPVLLVTVFFILDLFGIKFRSYYNMELNNFLFWVSSSALIMMIFFFSFIFLKFINNHVAQLQSIQSQLIQAEKLASLCELTAGISH